MEGWELEEVEGWRAGPLRSSPISVASRRGGTVSHTIFGVATSAAAILTRSCVGFAKPGVPFPVRLLFNGRTGAVCEKYICFANSYIKNGVTNCLRLGHPEVLNVFSRYDM